MTDRKTLRGDRNQRPGCSKYFNSTFAFDKHRTGRFGKDRRCMTTEEMTEAGMDVRQDGFWISERRPEVDEFQTTSEHP
jgi:hypothetical protein